MRRLGDRQRAVPGVRPRHGLLRRRLRGPLPRAEGQVRAPRRGLEAAAGAVEALRRPGRAAGLDRRGAGGRRGPPGVPGHRPLGRRELGGRAAVAAAPTGPLARAVRPGPYGAGAQGLHGELRGPQLRRPIPLRRPRGGGPRLLRLRAGRRPGHRRGPGLVPPAHRRADPHRPGLLRGPGDRPGGPPKPLGRMARRLQEIAALPVERRPVDLYAALAEVAR